MKVTVDRLSVDFSVTGSKIDHSDRLELCVVLTNVSDRKLRVNALFLHFATIMLQVRHADGTRVSPGPPPLPPVDDGETGRINLAPAGKAEFVYRGADFFGQPLPFGPYQARFRYNNVNDQYGDWTGTIETDWLDFEVVPFLPDESDQPSPPEVVE